jgi:hypothetical protein
MSTDPPSAGDKSVRLPRSARLLLAGLGIAAFAAGTVAVFEVKGGGGAGGAALLAVGAAALAVAGLGAVPRNLKVGGVEVDFPQEIQRLADKAAEQGNFDLARSLQVSADLASAAEPFSRVYDAVREIAPSAEERTQALDALVRMVERQAREGRWSPEEARTLFESGHEGARIFALAMLRAFPRPEDLDVAEEACFEPRSLFEQWHGLFVLRAMVGRLPQEQLERLSAELDSLTIAGRGTDSGRGDRDRLRVEIIEAMANRLSKRATEEVD